MAVSGSIDFSVTRDDIINEALELLGVLGEGETANSNQLTSSARTLNMMTKAWQADGLNLFAVERNYLFTQKDQHEYQYDSSTSDHITDSFVETTLNGDVSSGASTITVTDATGISNGDNIGIQSGTDVQWTTVNGAPAGNVITLTNTTTAASSDGETVYAYTSKSDRPMKVIEAYVHVASADTDIPLGKISRRQYNRLSQKGSDGLPVQFYYDPQISAPNLFLWPETSDETDYITFFVQRTLSDFDSASDNPEFPQEWYLPLSIGLAVQLAPKYGIPGNDYNKLLERYHYWYNAARDFDQEHYTSVYFTADYRGEEL